MCKSVNVDIYTFTQVHKNNKTININIVIQLNRICYLQIGGISLQDFDDELRQIDMDQKEAILVVRAYKRYLAKTDEDREYGTEVIERISNSDTTREDADFIIRCTEVIDNLIDKVVEEKIANKS